MFKIIKNFDLYTWKLRWTALCQIPKHLLKHDYFSFNFISQTQGKVSSFIKTWIGSGRSLAKMTLRMI